MKENDKGLDKDLDKDLNEETPENKDKDQGSVGVDGKFKYKHIRDGKVIDEWEELNIVVDQGLIYTLNTAVGNVAQISNWYIGLYKNNYTPLAGDLMVDFPGAGKADESTTEYSEGTRGAYTPTATNATTIINTPVAFTFTTAVSIYGGFMASESAKGATTGTLLSASKFASVRAMAVNDVLNVTYSLTVSDI